MVLFFNIGLFDRGYLMWECYIIDGIECGWIVILFKVYYVFIDGEGGLCVMCNFFFDLLDDMMLVGFWMLV